MHAKPCASLPTNCRAEPGLSQGRRKVTFMKPNELRDKTIAELNEELGDLKEELFRLRFQHAVNQLENPLKLQSVKRDIARVKTILRERELKGIKE
jgi:large subunit ribosomal protein L29